MKKLSFILLTSILFFTACKQQSTPEERTVAEEQTAPDERKVLTPKETTKGGGWTKTPLEGQDGWEKAVSKDQMDKLVEEGYLYNGEREGQWITFHVRNGLPATVTNYHAGKKQGVSLQLSDMGNLDVMMNFTNDALDGNRIVYKHSRIKEESFFVDGKLEGDRRIYYDDGKLMEEGTFKNGEREGVSKWYNQAGEVTIETKYRNGKAVK
ncbi:MAG: hypothetical protein R2798_02965 [Chitinophagales bacterium]|nr:hypothetical protein [Bacteroidota bacterium]MCB9042291.1 hypothetical protein [Chitinophagales bacterium]